MNEISVGMDINFDYVNWKGNKGHRRVQIMGFYYGKTEFHSERQLLMKAWDVDKKAERDFAIKDMSNVKIVTA